MSAPGPAGRPGGAAWTCPSCGLRGIGGARAWRGHLLVAHTRLRAVPLPRPALRPPGGPR